MSDYLDINNEELLKDFFSEAEMQVEQLESNILVIENDPANHDAIDEIFRAAHTLKGGSATVEMMELASFTHVVEDLLDEIRNGSVAVTEDVIDVLLDSICIGRVDVVAHPFMKFSELCHLRCKRVHAVRLCAPDCDFAHDILVLVSNSLCGILSKGKNLLCTSLQEKSILCKLYAVFAPLEEFCPQFVLKLHYLS